MSTPTYETLTLTLADHIATVRLNRPDKANAMNLAMWHEIRQAFQWIDATPEARVAIIEGEGKHFTSGIDLTMMMGLQAQIKSDCDGRTRENLRRMILDLQDTLSSIERCPKPRLAPLHCSFLGRGVRPLPRSGVREMAATIAAKSPLSIRGTKEMILYARDHSVADGLNYIATWNAAMLMSTDLQAAMMAQMSKQTPQFLD